MFKRSVICLAALVSGCVSSFIDFNTRERLIEQTKNKDYIAGLEGLGAAGYARDLTQRLCDNLDVVGVATAGNPREHLELIRNAKRNRNHVYIVGHSLGANAALDLAKLCEDKGIEVDAVFLMDITVPSLVHENVKLVVDIKGTVPYLFRGRELNENDLENPRKTRLKHVVIDADHLSLPERSREIILQEIRQGVLIYIKDFYTALAFDSYGDKQEVRKSSRQEKSYVSSEVFQNSTRGICRRRYISGNSSSQVERVKQRICKLAVAGYSRTA